MKSKLLINQSALKADFDQSLLENISWFESMLKRQNTREAVNTKSCYLRCFLRSMAIIPAMNFSASGWISISATGARETNSIFGFGLMALNKIQPVPSYLFLYSGRNKPFFIRKFNQLCLPDYDLGSNYPEITNNEINKLKKGTRLFKWDSFNRVKSIKFIQ